MLYFLLQTEEKRWQNKMHHLFLCERKSRMRRMPRRTQSSQTDLVNRKCQTDYPIRIFFPQRGTNNLKLNDDVCVDGHLWIVNHSPALLFEPSQNSYLFLQSELLDFLLFDVYITVQDVPACQPHWIISNRGIGLCRHDFQFHHPNNYGPEFIRRPAMDNIASHSSEVNFFDLTISIEQKKGQIIILPKPFKRRFEASVPLQNRIEYLYLLECYAMLCYAMLCYAMHFPAPTAVFVIGPAK